MLGVQFLGPGGESSAQQFFSGTFGALSLGTFLAATPQLTFKKRKRRRMSCDPFLVLWLMLRDYIRIQWYTWALLAPP